MAASSIPDEESVRAACPPFVTAMDLLGRRWTGLIVQAIGDGCCTFREIGRYALGIGDTMLSRRLKELELDGLVVRSVTDDYPPGVRYSLSPVGAALLPVLEALTAWGASYLRAVAPAAARGHSEGESSDDGPGIGARTKEQA